MTLIELNDFLNTKTWADVEAQGSSTLADWKNLVDEKDRDKALIMIIRWYNVHRPDEGYTILI